MVARDAERLARFRREAHLLASLNHPNIAAIYGLEEEDGKPFLALELVEGRDLKERLDAGAIPVDEALEIAERIYLSLDGALMSVGLRPGSDAVEVGMPTVLVPASSLRAQVEGPDYSDYAVSADGQRFLVKEPARGAQVWVMVIVKVSDACTLPRS